MATFKGIKGFTVQTLSSDPTTAGSVGQFYYNSTSNTFKYVQPGTVGAWSSGNNMGTPRGAHAGFGTQSASSAVSGYDQDASAVTVNYEEYDGSSWSEKANVNTARYGVVGCGTTTAGLIYGQIVNPSTVGGLTEEWNNTSWSVKNAMNTSRGNSATAGGGTTEATFVVTGQATPSSFPSAMETWNGTSWTEVSEINTARRNLSGFGVSTAAIVAGGTSPSILVESWNGSSWTEIAELNTAAEESAASGIQTSGLVFGGAPNIARTEEWNGSSWTEVADLATGRNQLGGSGTTTAGLAFGAENPSGGRNATEEWTVPDVSIKTVTTS